MISSFPGTLFWHLIRVVKRKQLHNPSIFTLPLKWGKKPISLFTNFVLHFTVTEHKGIQGSTHAHTDWENSLIIYIHFIKLILLVSFRCTPMPCSCDELYFSDEYIQDDAHKGMACIACFRSGLQILLNFKQFLNQSCKGYKRKINTTQW